MSDTIVVVRPAGVLFARNSGRDSNEPQIPAWRAGGKHAPGSTVRCTHLEIPQAARTWATLVSRPFSMWGSEMGSNERGVTIGREAVFTDQRHADIGLTGTDLVRLGLERSATAAGAVDVIVDLIEAHGQHGGHSSGSRGSRSHTSSLVADPGEAWVLETADSLWAAEQVTAGVRTITNGLTIGDFADEHRDGRRRVRTGADRRQALTTEAAAGGTGDLIAVLRSHGPQRWPTYRVGGGSGDAPCMHGGGILASASSVAGWVGDLAAGRHWITATSAQCLALFKPVAVGGPVDIGPIPDDVGTLPIDAENDSMWWQHERMARKVMRDPERLASSFLDDRDAVERSWLAEPPDGQSAFVEGAELLHRWSNRVAGAIEPIDIRPRWAKRFAAKQDRVAGI